MGSFLITLGSAMAGLVISSITAASASPTNGEEIRVTEPAKGYSSSIDQIEPRYLYWGDTHVHTYLSADAYPLGSRITPEEAYRFAKGEKVISDGQVAQLSVPLDFLMVSDHAENMGVFSRIAAGDRALLITESGNRVFQKLRQLPITASILGAETREEFKLGIDILNRGKAMKADDFSVDDGFKREIWYEVVDVAEEHNEPGVFTTFSGYEYSSGRLHRNVLFVGGPEFTKTIIPFSSHDSRNPEDLWSFLEAYIENTGSGAISIPHNSNISGGEMFSRRNFEQKKLAVSTAKTRSSIEPIIEVTQIKGDSETHPSISPQDEFADFEDAWWNLVSKYRNNEPSQYSEKDMANRSFARGALKAGLSIESDLDVNPFKFGMIGSTDSHTGLATAEEKNFWGKMATDQPSPYRAQYSSIYSASGYAAVWATENTREAIFAAMKRREVYATTGPRIVLRFFGGWDFVHADAVSPNLAEIGYRKGVSMGGDLVFQERETPPNFLLSAMRDPNGANLDRIQIIKGWQDQEGVLREKVYDVAWSGDRSIGVDGKLPAIQSYVNVTEASYRNTAGAPYLGVVWTDPDFSPHESSFYYARVIAIPTPRWNTYDARVYGQEVRLIAESPWDGRAQTVPATIQERAYSSPIWFKP